MLARVGHALDAADAGAAAAPALARELTAAGFAAMLLGAVLAAWAGWHHDRVRRALRAGCFEPASAPIAVVAAAVALAGLAVAALAALGGAAG